MRKLVIEPDGANFLEERRQMEKRYPIKRKYFLADLIQATVQIEDFSHEEFMSSSRAHRFTLPKWRLFHIARYELALTWSQIGRLLCRDPSTVIHGANKYTEEYLDTPTEQQKRAFIIARAESLFLNIPVENDAQP